MNRLFILLLVGLPIALPAQGLIWITSCSDQTFCLNQGTCNEGSVLLVEKAFTSCGNSNINYSYRIDLNNDGSQDIISTEDTIQGNFAPGTHKAIWRATDFCGNQIECSYLFTIQDCFPPSLICINGLTQNLDPPNCSEEFFASQFILSMSDNCTPTNEIEYGIREIGTGMGFPPDTLIRFDSCDIGARFVEIWVRDADGLFNSCQGYVLLQNGGNGCSCDIDAGISFDGCAESAGGLAMSQFRLRAAVTDSIDSWQETLLVEDSCYSLLVEGMPFGGDYAASVWATRNEGPLVGFSTFDLFLISKHILGIESFTSFYQMMAADMNNSQTVTTFDIVEGRKLLLGIYDTFPAVPSWRMIKPLANPANLDQWGLVEYTYQLDYPSLISDLTEPNMRFVGVKSGDVNLSANLISADDRSGSAIPIWFEDRWVSEGQIIEIPFSFEKNTYLSSLQLALQFDQEQAAFSGVRGLDSESYYFDGENNRLGIAWFDRGTAPTLLDEGKAFTLIVRVKKAGMISSMIGLDDDVLEPEAGILVADQWEPHALQLRSNLHASPDASVQFAGPSPNPFSEACTFDLWLEQGMACHLRVVDMRGGLIWEQEQVMESGHQELKLRMPEGTPSGWYVYQMQIGTELHTGRILYQSN